MDKNHKHNYTLKYKKKNLLICNTRTLVYELVWYRYTLHLTQLYQFLVFILQVINIVGRFGKNAKFRSTFLLGKCWGESDNMVKLCSYVLPSFLLRCNVVGLIVSLWWQYKN